MRRSLIFIALSLGWLAPTLARPPVGGVPSAGTGTSAPPAAVRQVADVTSFGAVQGGNIGVPLQAAIDHLAATYPGQPGVVRIPAGMFSVDKDVYCDVDKIEVVGAGRELTRLGVDASHSIIFGLPRSPNGRSLSNGHRPDLFGRLDTSACPTAGVRWGLKTWDAATSTWAHPSFFAGPFNAGKVAGAYPSWHPDFWSTGRVLTIDFALDAPGGTLPVGQIMGSVEDGHTPAPIFIWYNTHATVADITAAGSDPSYWFEFTTVDTAGAEVLRYVRVPAPNPTPAGVQRITLAIDLATPKVLAYVNRVQVAPDLNANPTYMMTLGPDWTAAAGLHFAPNQYAPWNLGAITLTSVDDGSTTPPGGAANLDRTFCGLRFTDGLLYKDRGPGQAQQRIDDLPLDDQAQFFRNDPGKICSLTLADPPGPDRRVTVEAGPSGGPGAYTRGLFLSAEHGNLLQCVRTGNALRDLTVADDTFPWGVPVLTGATWDFTLSGVGALGGYYGVGALVIGASFPITARDGIYRGSDAGYFGFTQILLMENATFMYPGRAALRTLATTGTIRHAFLSEPNLWNEYGFMFHGGGNGGVYTVEGINSDVEYVPGPRYAQICMDSHDKFWADSLTVRDCTFSKTDPGGATFLLRSRSPASSKGMCSIQNITVLHGENRAFLAVDDPLGLWRATVGGCPHVHPEVPWVEYARPGSVGHARVVLDDFAAEPTAGVWREGTELHLSPPPATGPLILKCTGAGDYGTATHPTWRGIP